MNIAWVNIGILTGWKKIKQRRHVAEILLKVALNTTKQTTSNLYLSYIVA
jgi:hypothetical protein